MSSKKKRKDLISIDFTAIIGVYFEFICIIINVSSFK